jgi:hypothetical protein
MTKEEQNMRIRSLFVNPKELLKNENHSILFLIPNKEVGNRILTSYTKEVSFYDKRTVLLENGRSETCKELHEHMIEIDLNKADFTKIKRARFINEITGRTRAERVIYPNIIQKDLQIMLYISSVGHTVNGTYYCSSFHAFMETLKKHVEHWERLYGCIDYYVEISQKGNIKKIYEVTFKGSNLIYYKKD